MCTYILYIHIWISPCKGENQSHTSTCTYIIQTYIHIWIFPCKGEIRVYTSTFRYRSTYIYMFRNIIQTYIHISISPCKGEIRRYISTYIYIHHRALCACGVPFAFSFLLDTLFPLFSFVLRDPPPGSRVPWSVFFAMFFECSF